MVWRLNINIEFAGSIDIDYPQFVSRWLNIGEKITSACKWINGRNYFFSYKNYYRYDHAHHQVNRLIFLFKFFIFFIKNKG
jgi:hypothetical protein